MAFRDNAEGCLAAMSPRELPATRLSPGAGLCCGYREDMWESSAHHEQGQVFGVVTQVGVCQCRAPVG